MSLINGSVAAFQSNGGLNANAVGDAVVNNGGGLSSVIAVAARAANQSVANATGVVVIWDTNLQNGSTLAASGAPFLALNTVSGVFTCVVSGLYRVNAMVNWGASTAGGALQIALVKNVTTVAVQTQVGNASTLSSIVFGYVQCAVGDTLSIVVTQNSGGAINVVTPSQLEISKAII